MFIRMPESPAAPLVLTEEGGLELTLKDRFLPYRPITIGGRQRAEFTWYPGSPEATVQMLGPEEDSIQLRGFWKDRFLGLAQSVQLAPNGADLRARLVESVADLVQVVDDMRRMGRRITLDWSGLKRVGHIVAFRQTWHNIHDCEWEIDFAVVSHGETTVPAVGGVALTIPDAYLAAVNAVANLQDDIIKSSGLPAFIEKTAALNSILNIANVKIVGVANALAGIAQGYANAVISVPQAAIGTVSTFTGAAKNLQVSVFSVGDTAASELFSWGVNGAEDNTVAGQVLAAFNVKRNFTNQFQSTRYAYASQASAITQQTRGTDTRVESYVAPKDLDYRDISESKYGTADNWTLLMQYNGASTSLVTAGTTVFVPPASILNGNSTQRGVG